MSEVCWPQQLLWSRSPISELIPEQVGNNAALIFVIYLVAVIPLVLLSTSGAD